MNLVRNWRNDASYGEVSWAQPSDIDVVNNFGIKLSFPVRDENFYPSFYRFNISRIMNSRRTKYL